MIGLGTIINVAAIIIGGLIGLIFSRAISARYQETLMQANGVCVLFVGISGTIQEMMAVTSDGLKSGGTMMIVISFAVGSLLGEWIGAQDRTVWKLAEDKDGKRKRETVCRRIRNSISDSQHWSNGGSRSHTGRHFRRLFYAGAQGDP